MSAARPVLGVLLSAAGLAVWAGHFTVIYAVTALACERGLTERALLGLPFVPAMVGLATLLALLLLGLVMRPGLSAVTSGASGTEPQFTRWFAATTALLAALAVLFQALPALVLPGCG